MTLQELLNTKPTEVQETMNEKVTAGEVINCELDRTKMYTAEEAASLYLATTGVCIDGTLKFLEKLNLPKEQKLSLFDIAEYSEGQWGHAAFVRNVLTGGLVNLTNDSIQMGKGQSNNHSNRKLTGRLTVEQKNADGSLTNSHVGDLDVDVKKNTYLKLGDIEVDRNFYIRSHTSKAIEINEVTAGNDITVIVDSAAKITGQMKANYNCKIQISTCHEFNFGITARYFDINISSVKNFLLRPDGFDHIKYNQSTGATVTMRIPNTYKVRLYGDTSKIDCPKDLIDENSSHVVQASISTGKLVIRAIN